MDRHSRTCGEEIRALDETPDFFMRRVFFHFPPWHCLLFGIHIRTILMKKQPNVPSENQYNRYCHHNLITLPHLSLKTHLTLLQFIQVARRIPAKVTQLGKNIPRETPAMEIAILQNVNVSFVSIL